MGIEERPRYVILVWMHDHWGVTFSTNDENEAKKIEASARQKVFTILIDTEKLIQ